MSTGALAVGSRSSRRWSSTMLIVFFIFMSVSFAFPLLWVLSLSLKDVSQVYQFPPRLFPAPATLANYRYILTSTRVPTYLWNSVKIVGTSVIGALLVSFPAAYGISRFRMRGKGTVMFLLLVVQMLSPMIIAIPLYRYFIVLGLLNTHAGVILIYIALQAPFATWVLKGFLDSLSTELDDAALIDGCNRYQCLTRIILPNAMPGLTSAVIIISVRAWSQFIIPFMFLSRERLMPIAVGILNYAETEEVILVHLLGAAAIVAVLPTVAVFIALQRYIVSALAAGGSSKG